MKKKHLLILCILISYIVPSFSQDTTYYDANWRITGASNASCFRLKIKKGTGWQVKDCYLNLMLVPPGGCSIKRIRS